MLFFKEDYNKLWSAELAVSTDVRYKRPELVVDVGSANFSLFYTIDAAHTMVKKL